MPIRRLILGRPASPFNLYEMRKIGIIDFGAAIGGDLLKHLIQSGVSDSRIVSFFEEPGEFSKLRSMDIAPRQLKLNGTGAMVEGFSDLDKLIILLPLIEEHSIKKCFLEINSSARLAGVAQLIVIAPAPGIGGFIDPFFNVGDEMDRIDFGMPFTLLLNAIDRESIFNLDFLNTLSVGGISSATNNGRFNFASRSDLCSTISRIIRKKGFENKVFHLTSSYLHSFEDMANVASKLTGTRIRNLSLNPSQLKETMIQSGTSEDTAALVVDVLHKKIAEGLFDYTTDNLYTINKGKEERFDTFAKKFLMMG